MQQPNERIIKKMIDNIVERNRPEFQKDAPASESATTSAPVHQEEQAMLSRKIEYGFNSLRGDLGEIRKQLDELNGLAKMLRNDIDGLRAQMRAHSNSSAPQPARSSSANIPPTAMGAPQYRKSEADEAYEAHSGQASHDEEPQQARGFGKKDKDYGAQVDISKVFYYGKK
jgi:hypothetical protein